MPVSSWQQRLKPWGPWLSGVALLALFYLALRYRNELGDLLVHGESLRGWLLGFGPWAPVVYVALYVAQIVIPPLPGAVLGTAGGYLFGFPFGLAYNYAGLLLGATMALWLGRRWGQPLVSRLATQHEWPVLRRLTSVSSSWIWLVIFLLPASDIAYFVAGLTRAPLRRLLLAVLLGRTPALLIATLSGAGVAAAPPHLAIVPLVALAGVVVLAYLFKDRITGLVLRHVVEE